MRIRTQLKAGKIILNHSEALRVRTTVKAGGWLSNHSEALRVRTTVKAGGWFNHSESLKRQDDREAISMRRTLLTTSRKDDRLELLLVRAGLRAGARRRGRGFHSARGRNRI